MEQEESKGGAARSERAACAHFSHTLQTEAYTEQLARWPKLGQFILAQYTDEAILVYQAFKPEIGKYAVEHQRFTGCPGYSSTRMTWIKPNFLWMMFRNGWGRKSNQEVTLGIWLKRSAFDRYILLSSTKGGGTVRLQWDPDHDPSGAPVTSRRAIQLGLKNVESYANGEDILRIDDLSPFVAECARNDPARLVTPKEMIYEPNDPALGAILRLSSESEEPLRLTLCSKGRRKMVLLHPRTMDQLYATIKQKFRTKALSVTDSTGRTVTQKELQGLSQDAVLHFA
ncbi:uncharacterized protein ACA1_093770 [Acanthamoeba castellanii str. Neff]|uniref:DUF4291 domain-containing protein n=1 Tax=Acanthamoeba castellanii (strain ATCC 30010 / Neff) TaxID=1257118 RepID=L8GIB3_ACACF|nr:uncharacterized protein ACA1_093770 [Acanthamoeba castellanii str. Neff]ELR12830.1 hypothetical protein ACA1_093770 [Acanthamoeba castellanii str. Neff]